MEQNDLIFIQSQIGYEFTNSDLLQQAFTRRSYSEENGGENNEVLEFIGDRVLEIIVVKYLAKKYGHMLSECDDFNGDKEFDEFACEKDEGELTEIKRTLVQGTTLAKRIDALGLSEFLITGRGDNSNKTNKLSPSNEDLFEAILGAVALDCNWDMEKMQNVVEVMLDPDSLLCDDISKNYVSLIQEWTYRKTGDVPLYHFEERGYTITWYNTFDGITQNVAPYDREIYKIKYHCLLKIADNLPVFRGFGQSQNEARKNVCKVAYEYLCKENIWLSIRDEIDNPNKNDAINQLEILARRGYFSIPKYYYEQTYDKNGNSIWECFCSIKEENKKFTAKSSSKKDAKKTSAFNMLKYVLNN